MKPILTTVKFALSLSAALTASMALAQKYALPAGTYHLVASAPADPSFQPGQPEGQSAADTKDDLFAGTSIFAKGASDVTEISMDPDSLGMVKGKDGARAHNTILSVVHTYSYDKPGMYRMEDVETFRQKLNNGDWHCSIHVRDEKKGESTDICSKHRTDGLRESAIITVEPKQLTFIHTIRRGGDGDQSGLYPGNLGGMMILNSGHLLPESAEMAVLNARLAPELAAMHANLQSMPDMAEMQARLNTAMKNMPMLEKLNSPDMQKQMHDLQKQLNDAGREHVFDLPGVQRNLDDLLAHPPTPASPSQPSAPGITPPPPPQP
jgi:hypothetical protein